MNVPCNVAAFVFCHTFLILGPVFQLIAGVCIALHRNTLLRKWLKCLLRFRCLCCLSNKMEGRGRRKGGGYIHQSPMRAEQRGQGGWMEGMSRVLLFLSIKLSLELRVTFRQSKQSVFYLLSQYGASTSAVCVCVCICVRVSGKKKKEGKKRDGGLADCHWRWLKKKLCSQKSNDSLPKLIYLSINDGYIPPNGFIN